MSSVHSIRLWNLITFWLIFFAALYIQFSSVNVYNVYNEEKKEKERDKIPTYKQASKRNEAIKM